MTKMIPGLANTDVIGDPITKQDVAREMGEKRPFYMMRASVREVARNIGYTKDCPGCRAVENNFSSRPPHTAECHRRMEPEMRKTPRGAARMEAFEHRLALR